MPYKTTRLYSQGKDSDIKSGIHLTQTPAVEQINTQHQAGSEVPEKATLETTDYPPKEELTPLAKHIRDSIKIQGPMSVAHFMRQVLVNPLSGYYMQGDVFGTQGDFITSPEISQMFGELLGIWFLVQWQNIGKPSRVQIAELGPGRGTLMMDMLRVASRFKEFRKAITGVHLIEASPGLRKVQRETLCGIPVSEEQVSGGSREGITSALRQDGLQIAWHDIFEDLPAECSMIVAHEFFDALPIYKFEKTEEGWRELVVDLEEDPASPYHLRFVLAPGPTQASKAFAEHPAYDHFKPGDRIEVSPDSFRVAHDMAKHINKNGGSALIVDYGKDHIQGDTLRGIIKHKFTHVLTRPGNVDLSADVDFQYLKQATEDLVDCHGSVTQAHLLHSLGIGARLDMLLAKATAHRRETLISSYHRLVDPKEMGNVYRAMAMTPLGSSTPIAFEKQQASQSAAPSTPSKL
ncbi:S-adenosyl-L-methionine-dependent methyltransferase [Gamsiella multidivaricata]|uniref:S-adenosyl-L-methionine-dependent methyltransferase n=1 Tax=Gamsiella multidivaricata TaxID=101098 RepID=UPI00222103BA|nr:S-adenosyl-L-methionine-dependent methyltransferase [Gamsiella multidivaricata]KAG0367084.1 NADH dehydrogenase [ubiquinone] complex I, assembly factor 7 [Gamsiella multidivaricata]KAI7820010.1 S-adenosyl-L-methionine-dependent methyltransferase [Gamsiella multidivaricata]